MDKWLCPNCSQRNGMHQHQCGRCRFAPVGLDRPGAGAHPTDRNSPSIVPALPSPVVEGVLLALLALLIAWLGWMAGNLPPSAREPFAVYLIACAGVGTWIVRRRRRSRRT